MTGSMVTYNSLEEVASGKLNADLEFEDYPENASTPNHQRILYYPELYNSWIA
jgi:hypothetical protein